MNKQVKDLTVAEQDSICAKQNTGRSGKNACKDCPLRWAKHCIPCMPIMKKNLITRMLNAIGERTVEITEEI